MIVRVMMIVRVKGNEECEDKCEDEDEGRGGKVYWKEKKKKMRGLG